MNTPATASIQRIVHFFETLTPQSLDALGQYYTGQALSLIHI